MNCYIMSVFGAFVCTDTNIKACICRVASRCRGQTATSSYLAFLFYLPHPGTHGFRAFMRSSEYYRGVSLSGQAIRSGKI